MDTMGGAATSALLICTVSGIFLAVPYDVRNPLDSISIILLNNPAASFIRNVHFWSAQIFLVFFLLHIIDHLVQNNESKPSKGIWFRLTFSVPVVLFVMISGFILKGDADAFSAFRILSSLFEKLPCIGNLLKDTFLGDENNPGLMYVHHIATATIIIFIVLYEHARKVWPAPGGLLIMLLISLLLGIFFQAPAGLETGKGPWYFVGFQEILQWFSRPGWTWLFLLIPLGMIFFLPDLDLRLNKVFKIGLLIFLFTYLILTILGGFFRGDQHNKDWSTAFFHPLTFVTANQLGYQKSLPEINGQREGCLVCHSNVTGFSPSHDPHALGCYSCHHGNPFSLDKNQAHKNMVLIPGNLEDAAESCGSAQCHPDIPNRVNKSIMTTMSGVVTVDRFVFGESDSLNQLAHIKDIGHSPADLHLRDLCANCHLGNRKTAAGPVNETDRGGGCNACHLYYSDSAKVSLAKARERLSSGIFYHPQLNVKIPDENCFSCHSRSGRIALNYRGLQETLFEEGNMPDSGKYLVLEDKRIVAVLKDDVHHRAGMSCIDCHLASEIMGDGISYAHKEDQVKISCEDCHSNQERKTLDYENLDIESKKIIAVRNLKAEGMRFIVSEKSNLPMINTWLNDENQAWLRIKSADTALLMKAPGEQCARGKLHTRLSCESCHTEWVPTCIGCHSSYDRQAKGFDMLENREKTGTWVEHVALFMADKPALGILKDKNGKEQVRTFTPGMILSIEDSIFRRLYAPISAHTTRREGRSCKSCHNDPLVLGYGRGDLVYHTEGKEGKWVFQSRFALNQHDQLPEDAWIGFLTEPSGVNSTRTNARPFDLDEQRKILTVGACLVCHPEDSKIIKESLIDFPALLKKTSDQCILPVWN